MTVGKLFLFIILLCMLSFASLYSESASVVDFFQLESLIDQSKYTPQQIQIRGFLYRKDSALILAAEPDLKTCCVGSNHKRHTQILVAGEEMPTMIAPASPVTLKGTLSQHPDHAFLYHLEEAVIVPEEPRSYTTVLVISGALAAASMMLLIRRKE